MTSTPSSVVTRGYGDFGSANLLPTLGYGSVFAEPAGIGLSTPDVFVPHLPVDFIMHDHGLYRMEWKGRQTAREKTERVPPRSESEELGEMMSLYAQWKKAA